MKRRIEILILLVLIIGAFFLLLQSKENYIDIVKEVEKAEQQQPEQPVKQVNDKPKEIIKEVIKEVKVIDEETEEKLREYEQKWIKLKQISTLNDVEHKRLAILTINTPPFYPAWSKIAVTNRKKYCKKHGYALYIEHGKSDPRSPVWSKISALLQHMEEDEHDWYWALDLDALLMNGDKKATELLDDEYDLIINNDCNWFNAGSFFIKNSEWSKQFLKKGIHCLRVLAVKEPNPGFFEEQAAMHNVFDQDPEKSKRVKYLPQKVMNAYRDYPGICDKRKEKEFPVYTQGDLVLHFPGHSKWDGFPDMIKDYASKATGLDDIEAP